MKQKIILVVSVAVGLLAAFLAHTYLAAKDGEYRRLREQFLRTHQTIEALCYARDLPAGSILAKSDLKLKKVPASGLRGQALLESQAADVIGRKLLVGHRQYELLFWADVEGGNPSGSGLSRDVRRKMRAVSINVSGAAAVSGMVRPNDHVDVIATFTLPKTAPDGKTPLQELSTSTILQNVLVLATGRETAKSASFRSNAFAPAGSSYSTVTLEVTPREAEMLAFAEQIRGRLSLALRNPADTYYEKELPQVDFARIRGEIEELNAKRQLDMGGRR